MLPLAPLTRTDSPQGLLARVAENVARISDREERQNVAGCLEVLAGLRFTKDLIRQFLSEDIMRESVIYQDIAAKERKQEAILIIMRLLNRRFSQLDSSLAEQVQGLSIKQLEELAEAFVDFSEVGDLVTWLNQQQRE
ncbi:hypothetical protein NUACC26_066350 [Scytonema sp. NUACC26]